MTIAQNKIVSDEPSSVLSFYCTCMSGPGTIRTSQHFRPMSAIERNPDISADDAEASLLRRRVPVV
jgi:hypothetical protein